MKEEDGREGRGHRWLKFSNWQSFLIVVDVHQVGEGRSCGIDGRIERLSSKPKQMMGAAANVINLVARISTLARRCGQSGDADDVQDLNAADRTSQVSTYLSENTLVRALFRTDASNKS